MPQSRKHFLKSIKNSLLILVKATCNTRVGVFLFLFMNPTHTFPSPSKYPRMKHPRHRLGMCGNRMRRDLRGVYPRPTRSLNICLLPICSLNTQPVFDSLFEILCSEFMTSLIFWRISLSAEYHEIK